MSPFTSTENISTSIPSLPFLKFKIYIFSSLSNFASSRSAVSTENSLFRDELKEKDVAATQRSTTRSFLAT